MAIVPAPDDRQVLAPKRHRRVHRLTAAAGEKPSDLSLSLRPHEADHGAYVNWPHHAEATLTFPQTIVLRDGRFEPGARKLPQAADDCAKWFLARLRGIDAVLADHR